MARKGNQHKNGLDHHSSNNRKKVSDLGCELKDKKSGGKVSKAKVVAAEEHPNGNQPSSSLAGGVGKTDYVGVEKRSKQKSEKKLKKEKQGIDGMQDTEKSVPYERNSSEIPGNISTAESSGTREENGTSPCSGLNFHQSCSASDSLPEVQAKNAMGNLDFSYDVLARNLRSSTLSILKATCEWLERQKPLFVILTNNTLYARDYIRTKIEQAYPVVWRWFIHFSNIMFLLSMVWLDCTLRGIDSFLRMGTTSFFLVVWCSILSVIAMIGMAKFLLVLVITALLGVFVGFTFGILVIAIFGAVFLWLYGSFWTTALVIFFGGLAFTFSHERVALFITTVYSVYCAWTYVGWLGLLLGLNLSFISSDALIYFLKNNINEHRRPGRPSEQTNGMRGRPGFFPGEPAYTTFSETDPGQSANHDPGAPSTSGADSEITSEDEVVRLLNCIDHYSALGLSRFENVDISVLKREYRKKAMLVHPDKNMGNEKAAEAFKKLQNAYEVLLDSLKRSAYDDELKREELLNCFRRFQGSSQKNGRHGFFPSGFPRSEGDTDDLFGESRRIACKKCGNFHVWVYTQKAKFRARWCQDCNDFHPAKDGDGWVEQSSQPLFFGILQKVEPPSAYVCAESKIYDATEWYLCQGMRCPANTHKPSFHVNTSVTSKHNSGKGTCSGQRSGGGIPKSDMEDGGMTEEEFFELFQTAMQSGMFDAFGASSSTENPFPTRPGNSSKTSSNTSGGASGSVSKRKKKGKKQR